MSKHTIEVDPGTPFVLGTTRLRSVYLYNVVVDGIAMKLKAKCKRTGRRTKDYYQVTYALSFDNSDIRNHPDFKEIYKEVKRKTGLPTVNFRVKANVPIPNACSLLWGS